MSRLRSFAKSDALLARALKVVPSGSQTFSKGHTQYPRGATPLFLERGLGSRVWDVDGNEFIDYPLALGPNILGHCNPAVMEAVARQLRDGTAFSMPHRLEVEVAEMIVERVPCAEMVRFGKNGSDATSGAVRLARAVTGRDRVACGGYHGWQDWYIGTTTRSLGVPEAVKGLSHVFEYGKLESLKALFDAHPGQFAAVVMEPVGVLDPEPGYLQAVADLTRSHGALLVYDEVVTGFRVARGGAQERYGVTPDLACFGKAMASGLPLSAVAGRRELMLRFDDIFFSFTAGGEALSLAACKATLLELDRIDAFSMLWRTGDKLRDGFNALVAKHGLTGRLHCVGGGPRNAVQFKDEAGVDSPLLRSLFQQEAAQRGVLILVGHNICTALTDQDIDETLAAYEDFFPLLKGYLASGDPRSHLRGAEVQAIFRKP